MSHHNRLTLAAFTAGDLSQEEVDVVRSHLESCVECKEALAQLRHNIDDYRTRDDEHRAALRARLVSEAAARTGANERTTGWWRWVAVAAAIAVAVVASWPDPTPPETPATVYKGTLGVDVVALHDGEQQRVTDGARLFEGDALRFVLTTGEPGFATVLSVDGSETVTGFYPEDGVADPMRLEAGRHELPGSVVLDDVLGKEHLVVAWSRARFDREPLHGTIRRMILREGPAALTPAALSVDAVEVLTIEKVSR